MKKLRAPWYAPLFAGLLLFAVSVRAETGHESASLDEHAGAVEGEHGGAHEEHEINVFHGFLGERDGVEPSLLWRPVGMPPPLAANVLNTALLFFIIYYFGKKPIVEALRKRKQRIVAGMDEAGKMREEASQQLEEYEAKLKRIDQEIERVRTEMRTAAEAERKRILEDAEERRARMQRDAHLLIEQELKAAREYLVRETVRTAIQSAEEILIKELGAADHERLASEYLDMVDKSVNAFGGRA